MLLAIDTSVGTSVAVVDRDLGIIVERSSTDPRGHAESIGTFIAECIELSGFARSDLCGVAIGMGPGPFTGLRVGIAAGRAFALGLGKPAVRIVSHDAIAYERYLAGHIGPLTLVTDARRRELYLTTYSGADADGLPLRDSGPELVKAELFDGAGIDTAVSDATAFHTTVLRSTGVSAGALGMLAERMLLLGRPFAGPEAIYLRSPDVTVPAAPKRVS